MNNMLYDKFYIGHFTNVMSSFFINILTEKETVYCKAICNSQNMQEISMKIYNYSVPDTNI